MHLPFDLSALWEIITIVPFIIYLGKGRGEGKRRGRESGGKRRGGRRRRKHRRERTIGRAKRT